MRHAKVVIFVHLVWGTWDRLPLLAGDVKQQVYRAIGAKCQEMGVQMIAIDGVEDHIHLLIQLPATLAIADFVKHVKGSSAHLVAQHTHTAEFFRWQGAYGAFSVGIGEVSTIRAYIDHQSEHHANGTTIPAWENAEEVEPNKPR